MGMYDLASCAGLFGFGRATTVADDIWTIILFYLEQLMKGLLCHSISIVKSVTLLASQLPIWLVPVRACVCSCVRACVRHGACVRACDVFIVVNNYSAYCLVFLITSDGRCINEIKSRMAQAKAYFHNMKNMLTNKRLSLGVRKRVMQCYIEPILLYGCESWSMTKQTSTSIEAMEMWYLRRMLRVSWIEKRTNLELLNTASSTRKLMRNIKRRQV